MNNTASSFNRKGETMSFIEKFKGLSPKGKIYFACAIVWIIIIIVTLSVLGAQESQEKQGAIDHVLGYIIDREEYKWYYEYDGNVYIAIDKVKNTSAFKKGLADGIDRITSEGDLYDICSVIKKLEALECYNSDIREQFKDSINTILQNKSDEYTDTLQTIISFLGSTEFYYDYRTFVNKESILAYMSTKRQNAFSSNSPNEIIDYANTVDSLFLYDEFKTIVSVQELLPYDEFTSFIKNNFKQTINVNDQGGYYDSLHEEYKGYYGTDSGGDTISHRYIFYGDFMIHHYEKKRYRPTGEAWEDELLEKYDESSVKLLYKGKTIGTISDEFESAIKDGQVYVFDDGKYVNIFIIHDKHIITKSGIDIYY